MIGGRVKGPEGAAFMRFLVEAMLRAGALAFDRKARGHDLALLRATLADEVWASVSLAVADLVRGIRPRVVGGEQTMTMARFLEFRGVPP